MRSPIRASRPEIAMVGILVAGNNLDALDHTDDLYFDRVSQIRMDMW